MKRLALLVIVVVTSICALAQEAPKPEKQPVQVQAPVSTQLNELETTKLQLITSQMNEATEHFNLLRLEAQSLHNQICAAHDVDINQCMFDKDLRSIVVAKPVAQRPILPTSKPKSVEKK